MEVTIKTEDIRRISKMLRSEIELYTDERYYLDLEPNHEEKTLFVYLSKDGSKSSLLLTSEEIELSIDITPKLKDFVLNFFSREVL